MGDGVSRQRIRRDDPLRSPHSNMREPKFRIVVICLSSLADERRIDARQNKKSGVGASSFSSAHHLVRAESKISSKVRPIFLWFPSCYPMRVSRRGADARSPLVVACGPYRRCLRRHSLPPPKSSIYIRTAPSERPPPYFSPLLSGLRTPYSPLTCLVGRRV